MASRIGACREAVNQALYDESKPWAGALSWAEQKTGVKRIYLFLMLVVFVAIYMVFGYAAQLFCNIIGFLYPAYCSIRAIESKQKDDDTKWLTYWVVFAFFSIIEYFAQFLMYWFPLYWLIKCLFFIWCFIPIEMNGSMTIYRRIIRPKFLQHEDSINNMVGNAARLAAGAVSDSLTSLKKGD